MALLRAFAGSGGIEGEIDGCTIRAVVFPGSHLRDLTLRRCSMIDVTVRRTDLALTRFLDCEARDVLFLEPRVATDSTRLELKGLVPAQVMGIRVPHGDNVETSYDPSTIAETLRKCGAPIRAEQQQSGPPVSADYIMLLEQLMRAYRRSNPVCKDDPNLKRIFTDPKWSRIERLLAENGVVEKETRATKGKPKDFLRRRFLPEQIMSGLNERTDTDGRIRAFWRALAMESGTAVGS